MVIKCQGKIGGSGEKSLRYFKQTFVSLCGTITETLSVNYEHRRISNFYKERENMKTVCTLLDLKAYPMFNSLAFENLFIINTVDHLFLCLWIMDFLFLFFAVISLYISQCFESFIFMLPENFGESLECCSHDNAR